MLLFKLLLLEKYHLMQLYLEAQQTLHQINILRFVWGVRNMDDFTDIGYIFFPFSHQFRKAKQNASLVNR